MISASDRLSQVLARDPRLVEVLALTAPALAALKDESMRRSMAPRVSVEQAARIAGLEPDELVARLNRALAGAATLPAQPARPAIALTPTVVPPELLATPPELLVDLDVREDLRAGREPFEKIMQAARALTADQVLRVRAIFEPAPLYGVFAKKGRSHFTEQLAPDDWRVWFLPGGAVRAAAPAVAAADTEDVIVLDVRDLEPPEPMVRTLEALERMPRGKTLLQINVRVPQFLLPKLDERGFVYDIREQSPDLVRLFIRHKPV